MFIRTFLPVPLAMTLAVAVVSAQGLTLDEAVARALDRHPILQSDVHAITAIDSQTQLNALSPPLTVGAELENFAGTGALSGASGAETTLRLSRVFELGRKREARLALGTAEVDRQRNGARVHRVEVSAEVARRFVAVAARQEGVTIARQDLELVTQVRDAVARWVEAKRGLETDLHQAEIAVVRARLAVDDAEHELITAKVALSALWGELTPSFGTVAAVLTTLPPVAGFAAFSDRLTKSADFSGYAFETHALEAQRRVAESRAQPDVSVSVGLRRTEALDDEALVLGLSMPLGNAERSSLAVERFTAELAGVEAREEAARLDAYQRLFELYQDLQHARHVFESHRDEMIPMADSAFDLTRRYYGLGRLSFINLMEARQIVVELRQAQIEAAARYHALLVEIDRLTAPIGAAP